MEGRRGRRRRPRADLARAGHIQGMQHDEKGDAFAVDRSLDDADAPTTTGSCCPAASRTPTRLRVDERAVSFVSAFFEASKPVGVICHGPWTLVEADVVRGRTLTSWPSLQTDIRNAGGEWVDRGGRRRPRTRHEPQARRPAGVLREARRGARRGQARRRVSEVIDHVAIRVSDLASSRAFYTAALAPLGFAELYERASAGRRRLRAPRGRRLRAARAEREPRSRHRDDGGAHRLPRRERRGRGSVPRRRHRTRRAQHRRARPARGVQRGLSRGVRARSRRQQRRGRLARARR